MNVYISTWFYESPKGERVYYPGVGNNSDSWDFQKIYWNCIYSFFESASKHCISSEKIKFNFMLFINNVLPDKTKYHNGFDPELFLVKKKGVEIINFKPYHIPADINLPTFRSQFTIIDILKMAEERISDDDIFILLDSDCLFVNTIPEGALSDLRRFGFQLIKNGFGSNDESNGLTGKKFNEIMLELAPLRRQNIDFFYGGEYFGFNKKSLNKFNQLIEKLYLDNNNLIEPLQTEEQLFTLAFSLLDEFDVSNAAQFIKRVWTDSEKFRTAQESDANLSILHLPAEKNKGFYRFSHEYIFKEVDFYNCKYEDVREMFNLA